MNLTEDIQEPKEILCPLHNVPQPLVCVHKGSFELLTEEGDKDGIIGEGEREEIKGPTIITGSRVY